MACSSPSRPLHTCTQVVACHTRVTDDLGDTFTKADVEWLLQEHNLFEAVEPPTAGAQQAQQVGLTTAEVVTMQAACTFSSGALMQTRSSTPSTKLAASNGSVACLWQHA